MTILVQSALSRAGVLVTAAYNCISTATATNRAEERAAVDILETVVDRIPPLLADLADPGDTQIEGCSALAWPSIDHLEGPADQRAYNLARLLEHAKRLLCDQTFDDRQLAAEVIALVLAAAVELDAVSLVLEQRDRAALLATAA